jgi:hypothetical protein
LCTKKNIIIFCVAIVIIIAGVLLFVFYDKIEIFGNSAKRIGENTIKYINDNKLSQTPASLVSVASEHGLVKIRLKIDSQEFDSYVTKDGVWLFPNSPIEMKKSQEKGNAQNDPGQNSETKTPKPVVKNDKPVLEAFVVSKCPFGLQMQRMMAEAIKSASSLSQYFKVRYFGSISGNTITAMHGEAEAKENLRQICIREEQASKYWSYISCHIKAGETASCENSTGIDSAKIDACVASSSRGIAYAKEDFDLANKYNVSGSPTLILNGSDVSEFDYGGRTADAVKSVVCAGFNAQPSFCSTKLNTQDAAANFSATYASSGNSGSGSASCGQ